MRCAMCLLAAVVALTACGVKAAEETKNAPQAENKDSAQEKKNTQLAPDEKVGAQEKRKFQPGDVYLTVFESRVTGGMLMVNASGQLGLDPKREFTVAEQWISRINGESEFTFEYRPTGKFLSLQQEMQKAIPPVEADPKATPPVAAVPGKPAIQLAPVVILWENDTKSYSSTTSAVYIDQQWRIYGLENGFSAVVCGDIKDPPHCWVLTAEASGAVTVKQLSPNGFDVNQCWLVRNIQ